MFQLLYWFVFLVEQVAVLIHTMLSVDFDPILNHCNNLY